MSTRPEWDELEARVSAYCAKQEEASDAYNRAVLTVISAIYGHSNEAMMSVLDSIQHPIMAEKPATVKRVLKASLKDFEFNDTVKGLVDLLIDTSGGPALEAMESALHKTVSVLPSDINEARKASQIASEMFGMLTGLTQLMADNWPKPQHEESLDVTDVDHWEIIEELDREDEEEARAVRVAIPEGPSQPD